MWGIFQKSKSSQKAELWDAAENFNRALAEDRSSRGEPVSGVGRRAWEAQRWARGNSSSLAGVGIFLAAAGVGYAFYRSAKAAPVDQRRAA